MSKLFKCLKQYFNDITEHLYAIVFIVFDAPDKKTGKSFKALPAFNIKLMRGKLSDCIEPLDSSDGLLLFPSCKCKNRAIINNRRNYV